MPPHVLRVDQDGCYAFYSQLAAAVKIPICVQNFDAPVGTPMSGDLLGRMCRELPGVDYIKEETVPEPRQVSRTLAVAGDACKGVLGGKGGIFCSTNSAGGPAAICRAATLPTRWRRFGRRSRPATKKGAARSFVACCR